MECLNIVLPKYKTVIFVNGCFWHKHDCKRFVWPVSNYENTKKLQELGWKVIAGWKCELKKKTVDERLHFLIEEIKRR